MKEDLSFKHQALTRANVFFLIGLAISIPASKAGMNAFLYLYALSSLLMLTFTYQHLSVNQKRLLTSSVLVLCIGTFLAFFSKGHDNDVLVFLQKYAYLLLPIAFVITVTNKPIAFKWSLVAFLLSVIICLFIDLYSFAFTYDFFRNGSVRLWGQIGYSRWPIVVVTAISLALMFELNSRFNKGTIMAFLVIALGLFGLALSGTKGGIVAAAIVGLFYLLIQTKKHWLVVPTILVLLVIVVNSSIYHKTIGYRLSYDTLTQSGSTLERVVMIQTSGAITNHNLKHDLSYFFFGSGIEKPEVPFQAAIDSLEPSLVEQLIYNDKIWGHTDVHNSYLDQLLKNGALFSLIFYVLLVLMMIQGYRAIKTATQYQYIVPMYFGTLFAYAVFNCFYSNFADYAVYSQMYFIALAIALPIAIENNHQSRT